MIDPDLMCGGGFLWSAAIPVLHALLASWGRAAAGDHEVCLVGSRLSAFALVRAWIRGVFATELMIQPAAARGIGVGCATWKGRS